MSTGHGTLPEAALCPMRPQIFCFLPTLASVSPNEPATPGPGYPAQPTTTLTNSHPPLPNSATGMRRSVSSPRILLREQLYEPTFGAVGVEPMRARQRDGRQARNGRIMCDHWA